MYKRQGLRGQRTYSFHASDNIITQYQRLAAALLEETEQTDAFLNTEAAYNRFVYDHYTDIPDDIRGFLEEKLGGYEKDAGQVHFDYRRAKQNILFYLTTYSTYEENVLPITGGDFALTFLDGTQSGYDVHYATAAALMFRSYGIPARHVEGFLVTKDDAAHMTCLLYTSRDYVLPDDVAAVFADVCAHRLILSPKARITETTAKDVLAEVVQQVRRPDHI